MLSLAEMIDCEFTLVKKGKESFSRIFNFLEEIGIEYAFVPLPATTFLPGIDIRSGKLEIDPQQLKYPGDILHEAGHIAVTAPENRHLLDGDIGASLGENASPELGVLPWTYAAACHLGLPLDVIFHDGGYKEGSEHLIDVYTKGATLGQPLLAWMEMCQWGGMQPDLPKFPAMAKWMRS